MPYPSSIPFSEVRQILDIAKGGNIKDSAPLLAYNIWVVQGYAQNQLFGNPPLLMKESVLDSDQDGLEVLEKLAASEDSVETQSSIPWGILLKYLAKLTITLLEDSLA